MCGPRFWDPKSGRHDDHFRAVFGDVSRVVRAHENYYTHASERDPCVVIFVVSMLKELFFSE